jgi:Flp pilus assembly protein TadB
VIVRDNLVTFRIQTEKDADAGGIRAGAEVITIRYAALPEGLPAQARAQGRRTIIYLRPGLTAEQRRLSLRRARQSARMGYGPRLPGPGVALAVARHVAGGTLRNLAAAVRRHPIGFLLLSAALVALVALVAWYALSVTVSVRLVLDSAQVPPR